MRRLCAATLCILLLANNFAAAQEPPNYDEISRRYQDALNQLKSAQDRKNELATENEKLNGRLNDLQRQLDDAHRDQATFALQTYSLRAQVAAWGAFAARYPGLKQKWELFLSGDPLAAGPSVPSLINSRNALQADD